MMMAVYKQSTHTNDWIIESYREAIEEIIHLPGIVIEVVGQWICVTGNTQQVKEELKVANFFSLQRKLPGTSTGSQAS